MRILNSKHKYISVEVTAKEIEIVSHILNKIYPLNELGLIIKNLFKLTDNEMDKYIDWFYEALESTEPIDDIVIKKYNNES